VEAGGLGGVSIIPGIYDDDCHSPILDTPPVKHHPFGGLDGLMFVVSIKKCTVCMNACAKSKV
jgi:hypothetical protein